MKPIAFLSSRSVTPAGAFYPRAERGGSAERPEFPYELTGSMETLWTARNLIKLTTPASIGPVSVLWSPPGIRISRILCQRAALVHLWRECTVRQCNLLRQLMQPVAEGGIAGRFLTLERVKRLALAALGGSERNPARIY